MLNESELTYAYDGSFEGLMCCVFASYERKEIPALIKPPSSQQSIFAEGVWIETDTRKADRVYNAVSLKISPEAQEMVRLGFLTCAPNKESLIFHFLRKGFKYGGQIMTMLTDDVVVGLHKAVRRLTSESHKYKGFVRFSVYGEVLVAVIEPKNYVLPLLSPHFCDRFRNERFMIFDKTHSVALIYEGRQAELIVVEDLTLPETDAAEAEYRRLWRQFYNTIAVEGRTNPRCRMTLMPKRYWGQMTEFAKEDNLVKKSNFIKAGTADLEPGVKGYLPGRTGPPPKL